MIGLTYKGKLKKNEKLNLNKKKKRFCDFQHAFSTVYDKHTCISIGHVSIGTHGLITSCSKG